MIIQGTTPTHAFTLPFEAEQVKTARFVYSESGEVKVIKGKQDIKLDGDTASTTLTQEDTFKFTPDATVDLVLRVLTTDGRSLTTYPPERMICRGSADKEVLT